MPSPALAPDVSIRKPQAQANFGSKLAKRKSQEFTAKVAQWNSTGGGILSEPVEKMVVGVPDAAKTKHADESAIVTVIEPENNNDDHSSAKDGRGSSATPSNSSPHIIVAVSPEKAVVSNRLSREVDLSRKAWVRRKSKTQVDKVLPPPPVDLDTDVKHAGTPKKRVISDGHWRRDRAAKVDPEDKPVPIPKPLVVRQSVASIGFKIPSQSKSPPDNHTRKPLRTKHTRRSRSKSRSRSRERSETPDYESSGTKVYVKRRNPSRQLDSARTSRELRTSTSDYTDSSANKQDISTSKTTPMGSPTRVRHHTPEPANVVERYLNALSPAEFFDPNRNVPETTSPRAIRRKSIARDRESVAKEKVVEIPVQPLSAPPKVFGNRIQGWLAATTSDPFNDRSDASSPQQSHARHTHEETSLHGRLDNELDSDQALRSPTLKRRGARRTAASPVKDRASRNSTPIAGPDQEQAMVPFGQAQRKSSRELPPLPRQRSLKSRSMTASNLSEHERGYGSKTHLLLEGSVVSHASDGDDPRPAGELKRRLTKHSDLMSVLSVQRSGSRAVRARPSVRSRHMAANLTIGDVMNELSTDEINYQRELRTLVDGVIPVLLQHVLSQSDVVANTNLLGHKTRDGEAVTKPIVDMGVALERLKSFHRRIPMHNHEDLLDWAESAAAVYAAYLNVWRMGFQNIVVNLAPAEPSHAGGSQALTKSAAARRDAIECHDDEGERVDVSFLLKRPLVRLKHMAKTFEAVEQLSRLESAKEMSKKYHELVQEAKRRSNEEKARLEDEAAAAIDPTRAREVRTLAPISGVLIDATRCVRARDFFDLDLRHTNGQQLNCKIELIIRDDAPGCGKAGDLLFCEVSTTGRWLLFPPVHSTMISARKGRQDRQLVVMLRGYRNDGSEWREVMVLDAEDEEAVAEWLSMLPAQPIPRNLAAKSSFDMMRNPLMSGALPEPASPGIGRMPSVRENEVPIGEQYEDASTIWDASEVNSNAGDHVGLSLRRKKATRHQSQPVTTTTITEEPYSQNLPTRTRKHSDGRHTRPRSSFGTLQDTRPSSSYEPSRSATPKAEYSVWLPQPDDILHDDSDEDDHLASRTRPSMHGRTSSVPSLDLPSIPKLRKQTRQDRSTRDDYRHTPERAKADTMAQEPSSAPAKLQERRRTPPEKSSALPSSTSPTQTKPSTGFRASIIPSLTPAFLKRHRRSSSPLKHEYEPSTDSSSDSEVSAADKEESFTSESTVEFTHEDQISTVGELVSFPTFGGYKPMRQATPPESLYAPSDPSLAPSQSASQAPYRTVPAQEIKARETNASIFAWAESDSWESLHPEECCIVVTPGLIEAFDNAQAHAAPAKDEEEAMQSPSMRGVKPLVALEMTPLVPLRRGTALDISIRSPPTSNSLYRTGNNIMFRSRNAEECEALYHMLNRARIDNPTYIALQRARGPAAQSNWGEVMEQRANARASASWWTLPSRKSTTYRSKTLSRPQSIAVTESSVGTLNTAFSALRRFSGSNRIFNIAKSTITSRQGSRSTYSDSLDSGITNPALLDPSMGTPLGLTNMKIRLYVRETASKWRDMGAARLTILIPPRADPSVPANPAQTGREKRVVITGKTKGEMLLDKTLGEACFERIARTGIAISVWEENVDGQVATTGGVLAARTRVYMIQMKSDREAAYTFGLVGKLRY